MSIKGLVEGWGVNDVDYPVIEYEKVEGKWFATKRCPYYTDWKTMIHRCFSKTYLKSRPTYSQCTICEEWKYLSNFIKWVDSQPNRDWKESVLDKDFLSEGNKQYSPYNTVYITRNLNNFLINNQKVRTSMLGVVISPYNTYLSRCSNPFTGKQIYLGSFKTMIEAHKAWQAKKHEYALRLADEQDDPRIAKVLRERYAPDKDWTSK